MNFRNASRLVDGGISCEVEHSKFGWVACTARADDPEESGRDLFAAIEAANPNLPDIVIVPLSHDEQAAIALAVIDQIHAEFLSELTGAASSQERDTWKVKAEAARAVLASTASAGQTTMIATEAVGRGVTTTGLAQIIRDKADSFMQLVGAAGSIRSKARAAVAVATDSAVPLANVAPAIDQALTQARLEVQAATASWLSAT